MVNCTVTKTTFSNYIAEFTSCSLQNSRPVKLCESCIDEYINVLEGYENLTKVSNWMWFTPIISVFSLQMKMGLVLKISYI